MLQSRYYERKIRGSLASVLVVSSSIGPFMVGLARDTLGGYEQVLLLFVLLALPIAVASLFATPPVRHHCVEEIMDAETSPLLESA